MGTDMELRHRKVVWQQYYRGNMARGVDPCYRNMLRYASRQAQAVLDSPTSLTKAGNAFSQAVQDCLKQHGAMMHYHDFDSYIAFPDVESEMAWVLQWS